MKFDKANFTKSGDYLTYSGKFVARFKYNKKSSDFKAFLIKNFTEEEYFTRLTNKESPLEILLSKGFVPDFLKQRLVLSGFDPSPEGVKAMNAYLRGAV